MLHACQMDGGSATGHLTAPAAAEAARGDSGPRPRAASRRWHARRELLALAVLCLWAFDLALHLDLAESLLREARAHEVSGIGEVPALIVTGLLGVCLIAWRRHLDGLGEARALDHAQQPLAVSHEKSQSLAEGP